MSVKLKFTNQTGNFKLKKKKAQIHWNIHIIFQVPIFYIMKSLTSTWNPRIKAFTKSAAFVRAVTSLVSLQVCFKKGTNYRWGWKRQYANRILEMTYLTIIPTLPSFPSIFSITQFLMRQVLCLICKTELSSFKAGEFHPKTVKWLNATTDYTPWLNWLWG